MAHNCTDWTVSPPTRKIPLLVLSRGDDRVYTTVPKELKASSRLRVVASTVDRISDTRGIRQKTIQSRRCRRPLFFFLRQPL